MKKKRFGERKNSSALRNPKNLIPRLMNFSGLIVRRDNNRKAGRFFDFPRAPPRRRNTTRRRLAQPLISLRREIPFFFFLLACTARNRYLSPSVSCRGFFFYPSPFCIFIRPYITRTLIFTAYRRC